MLIFRCVSLSPTNCPNLNLNVKNGKDESLKQNEKKG